MSVNDEYKLYWVGLCRIFRTADNFVSQGGELSKFDEITYKYLFDQLSEEQKEHVLKMFAKNLDFLKG